MSIIPFTPKFYTRKTYIIYTTCFTFSFSNCKFYFCLIFLSFLCILFTRSTYFLVICFVVNSLYHLLKLLLFFIESHRSNTYILRYKFFYTEYFRLIAIFLPLYYHFYHRFYDTIYIQKKLSFKLDLFRQTESFDFYIKNQSFIKFKVLLNQIEPLYKQLK